MVITVMSTTDDSENGESHQSDELTRVKEKLKVQQRLIDISARTLQSTRLSTDQSSSSLLEGNLRDKEAKLMKGFSRQLLLKRQYLKQLSEGSSDENVVEEVAKQLDELISFEQFLNITGVEPKSVKALLSGDNLTLDALFSLSSQDQDLEQLFKKADIPVQDRDRLVKYLDQLGRCYDSWESRDTPSMSSVPVERYNSTTSSRLNSLGSFDQDGVRTDSVSSCTSAGNSPRALRASTTHTPTPNTPSSTHTPTPITPSSSHSLLSPATFTYSTPVGGYEFTSNPQTPNSASFTHYSKGLSRAYSSSSSVLLDSPPHSLSQSNHLDPPQLSQPAVRKKSVFSHKRSKSNPPSHFISREEEVKDEPVYENGTAPSYAGIWNRSSSPPSRAGSNPSITSYSIHGPGGSPSAIPRGRHPQMRRISGLAPSFSQTISNDQLMAPKQSGLVMSGSESILCRQNTCPEPDQDLYPRSNSLAGMTPARRSISSALYQEDVTSSSMVDLPVRMHAMSSEHLDQIDEYGRPDANKSRSVPRLTFMTVSVESDKGIPTSAPTSPRTPGTYTPTGHMGHAIKHRFTARSFISPHVCDYCKKTVIIGVRCKHCKYKCHKTCSKKAPHSCGLPDGLMDFFRKQIILTSSPSPSVDSFMSPTETHPARSILSQAGSVDMDMPESPAGFVIHELSKEPSSTIHFSPVMGSKKNHFHQNGRKRSELLSQTSSTSLLEVPMKRMPGVYRSTSSSPSITPPTSPSLTPSSPRSPMDSGVPIGFPSPPHSQLVRVVFTDESGDESYEDHLTSGDSRSESPFSSREGSTNDISDPARLASPQGLRPPPQVVMAQSLPDLLSIESSDGKLVDSRDSTDESNGYFSDDILGGSGRSGKRKESLVGTLSTGDSKTSTLVNSNLTEEEDTDTDYDEEEEYRPRHHRPSVIDEWSIPYDDIRNMDLISKGPVVEVYKGYWHGEVAIKRFLLPDATYEQITKFKEEVAILKKTRHENLALFMGASLTAPNLAIVTSFCKGQTLYKKIHLWNEHSFLERSLAIANQVAQAVGYLHARGIVAKDLNTKNIFVEKEKVVITDTGLSSLTDNYWMQQNDSPHYVVIPRTKLYYLAPELISILSPCLEPLDNGDFFPYSEKTDVYAFGTVLYELLFRKFPYSTDIYGFSLDPTSVIFQVGSGKRPDIQSREIPRRIKELLLDCMHFDPKKRFPFTTISDALVKLSRKKTPISRSPSFPTNLSRSSEAINFL